jgi:serine/threonine-protein kinase
MESRTNTTQVPTQLFCPKCGQRQPLSANICPDDGTPLLPLGTQDDLTGTILKSKYLLLNRLGRGAFGSVYRALHRIAKAEVAVKILHEEKQEDDRARRMFLKEAQAVMRIQSRHAVLVNDVDEDDDGRLFIVMEFLRGVTLEQYISQVAPETKRLTVSVAADLCAQVCSALEDAHEKGVIHRDLKPANVMILEGRNGRPEAKVVDFGIARLHSIGDSGNTTTQTIMATAGTPAYMSPEQCRGLDVDGRADLYGLGVMLYELMSGVRPFQANTSHAMIIAHAIEIPQPLSTKVTDGSIPAALDQLVASLLAKDVNNRPATAAEVGQQLRSFVLEPGTRAAPGKGGAIPGSKALPWIVAALLTVAVAGLAAWWMSRSPSESVPATASETPGTAAVPGGPAVTGVPASPAAAPAATTAAAPTSSPTTATSAGVPPATPAASQARPVAAPAAGVTRTIAPTGTATQPLATPSPSASPSAGQTASGTATAATGRKAAAAPPVTETAERSAQPRSTETQASDEAPMARPARQPAPVADDEPRPPPTRQPVREADQEDSPAAERAPANQQDSTFDEMDSALRRRR